ncbi:hypothetical protein SCAR479_13340 [Seiridium cardinale]|uniref:Uncharacterized protein n=1 Tax=Seiridium cardinale TaxID=138064 RepID=A0ABR2X8H9_9PEZI
MASLSIKEEDIPMLDGKVSIITGGASGIGLEAAKILLRKNAVVHVLDLHEPNEIGHDQLQFHRCDVGNWQELRDAFDIIGPVDLAFSNAGITETFDYFADAFDDDGKLVEPAWTVFDVNVRATFNFVKLARRNMKQHQTNGSIVITTSAVAYAPEHTLPVYSSSKLATIGLIRSLRPVLGREGITINGVAPSMAATALLPKYLEEAMSVQGLPVSSAYVPGLALVFAATASQERRVGSYGKETEKEVWGKERWNGRIILTLGDSFSELEETIADLQPFWFGLDNFKHARRQQAATDMRTS